MSAQVRPVEASVVHRHHRKLRRHGDERPCNIMYVDPIMHTYIHDHPAKSYEKGWLVKSHEDPKLITVQGFELGVDGWHGDEGFDFKEFKSGSVAGEPSETGPEGAGKAPVHQAGETKCPRCKGTGAVQKGLPPAAALPKRKRAMLGIRLPKDADENGIEILESLLSFARDDLRLEMGWSESVAAYYVLVAVLHDWITSRASATKEA